MSADTIDRPEAASAERDYGFTFGTHTQRTPWVDRRRLTWPQLAALLTTHGVGQKEGTCIVPATFFGGERKKGQAERIEVAFLDSDAGYPLADIVARIRAKGWAAIVASTHSHMTTETKVKRSNYDRWLAHQQPDASVNLAAAYLEEEKGFLADVAIDAQVAREEGAFIYIRHGHCPKFRIAIPLSRPWVSADHKSQDAANALWKERVEALAGALHLDHDQSCTDTSRLFYLPRRPENGVPAETAVVEGQPCDIFALAAAGGDGLFSAPGAGRTAEGAAEKPKAGKKRKPRQDGAAEFVDGDGEVHDLSRWARRHGLNFEIAAALRARKPEVLTGHVADRVKHHILCPNEEEHTNAGADGATFVTNASEANNKGFVIHCRHGHCTDRDRLFFLRRMLEQGWLTPADLADPQFRAGQDQGEMPPPSDNGGPALNHPLIRMRGGALPEIVDAAEDALLRAELGFYQRGKFIVQPGSVLIDVPKKGKVDALQAIEVEQHGLAEGLTKAADWEKYDARSDEWVQIDAPPKVALTYIARAGKWRLPVLTGIITAPTIRQDGSLLATPGYDRRTGLLLDLRGFRCPAIPEEPSREDALAALALLRKLIRDFGFVADKHRSVALSCILTALIRQTLPTAPAHAFTAPVMGSGKSKLVDISCMIAVGRVAAVLAQGKTEEEMEKRLGGLLLAADPFIAVDNCEMALGGDVLCQMLTQQSVRVRILGASNVPELPTRTMVTATGNNLQLVGDMTRRTLMCRIDPNVERPELRQFEFDPLEVIRKDRGLFVVAALTILRAFWAAGRPQQRPPLGSFEAWSLTVRDALIWLGQADPVDTMEEARETDQKLEALVTLMAEWRKVIGFAALSSTEIISRAEDSFQSGNFGRDTLRHKDFHEALMAVAGLAGLISKQKLGRFLGSVKGRIVDGLKVVQLPQDGGRTQWKLEAVEKG